MKKIKFLSLVLAVCVFSSCYTIKHTVGSGGTSGAQMEKKQWYAVWGLVPINKIDTKAMAAGAENYTITTQHSFVDYVISFFTNIVTINVMTVKVEK